MATINQLVKKKNKRISKKKKTLVPALEGCPMKLATINRIFQQAPVKPNSARRKVAKVKIKSSSRIVACYLPGIKNKLNKHHTIMLQGGRCRDLIGVRYRPVKNLENYKSDMNQNPF